MFTYVFKKFPAYYMRLRITYKQVCLKISLFNGVKYERDKQLCARDLHNEQLLMHAFVTCTRKQLLLLWQRKV